MVESNCTFRPNSNLTDKQLCESIGQVKSKVTTLYRDSDIQRDPQQNDIQVVNLPQFMNEQNSPFGSGSSGSDDEFLEQYGAFSGNFAGAIGHYKDSQPKCKPTNSRKVSPGKFSIHVAQPAGNVEFYNPPEVQQVPVNDFAYFKGHKTDNGFYHHMSPKETTGRFNPGSGDEKPRRKHHHKKNKYKDVIKQQESKIINL